MGISEKFLDQNYGTKNDTKPKGQFSHMILQYICNSTITRDCCHTITSTRIG